MAKMTYAGELTINPHYGGRAVQCIIIISDPSLPQCLGDSWRTGSVGDTVDFGEVACVGHVTRAVGTSASAHCPPEKLPASEDAPGGSGRGWVSESSSIKQMAANGLFPILQGSNS